MQAYYCKCMYLIWVRWTSGTNYGSNVEIQLSFGESIYDSPLSISHTTEIHVMNEVGLDTLLHSAQWTPPSIPILNSAGSQAPVRQQSRSCSTHFPLYDHEANRVHPLYLHSVSYSVASIRMAMTQAFCALKSSELLFLLLPLRI